MLARPMAIINTNSRREFGVILIYRAFSVYAGSSNTKTRTCFSLPIAVIHIKCFSIVEWKDAFSTCCCRLGAQVENEGHMFKLCRLLLLFGSDKLKAWGYEDQNEPGLNKCQSVFPQAGCHIFWEIAGFI